MRKLLGLDASCVVRFGQPLDCFGNRVDEDGTSYDDAGHAVSASSYLVDRAGRLRHDPERDAQYTRELGEAIVDQYRRNLVVMPTHLVAACALERLVAFAGPDIFSLLRTADDVAVSRVDLADRVERLRDRAREMEDRSEIVLGPRLARATGREILDEGIRAFNGYHTRPVLLPRGDDVVLADPRLILYYQNRLAVHGLGIDAALARSGSGGGGSSRRAEARRAHVAKAGATAS
jgi:glycerol-3-phosphate O-acyltransferase